MVINFFEYIKEDFLHKNSNTLPLSSYYIETKFHEYVKNIILWEFILVLSTMLLLYKIIDRMIRQEREYRNFLEILILTISHKFGNFLAAQQANLELLKLKNDSNALSRLEKSYKYIQEDFHSILEIINTFKEFSLKKEKINIKAVIERTFSILDYEFSNIQKLKDFYIYTSRQLIENIIIPLIENAIKYSRDGIQIRLTKKYLAIRNKIYQVEKGSGIGLKIAEAMAKKGGFTLTYRAKGEYFIALLKFKS